MVNFNDEYDKTSPEAIENYAQRLIGMSFQDVIDADSNSIMEDSIVYDGKRSEENKKNKGNLGQIIEERFFHYPCNNDSRPDFHEAGVELKVTPYKINSNGKISAKERLILTKIDYYKVVEERFEESHLWNKSKLILLIYYRYLKDVTKRLDYKIDYAKLFTPPEQDLQIIKHDFTIIVEKIKAGKAHELSEGDTLYLGAATKAASSKDKTNQPFSDELAKPRAFSFKNSYMTYVLNNYIISSKKTYEPILKKGIVVDSFEEYVADKIDAYCGRTVQELCEEFDIPYGEKKPKNLESLLAFRILGIKGNKAEEFMKANIVVKTIRIGNNNKIKESMSFPRFKFKELVEEEWETSKFRTYLEGTRFMFVVYKFNDDGDLILKGCQFWHIPYNDLQREVYTVWATTKKVLLEGLKISIRNEKNHNNFPKPSDNDVCHVRPHGTNAADTDELPDGRMYPKQCFWLKNSYIQSQLKKKFFE